MKPALLSTISALSAICTITALRGADPPKFETASVKRADQCSMQNSVDPALMALKGDPLKAVLMEAYKVQMDQIEGPSWLDADCFDIIAKIPEGAIADQRPAMLQALLAERFKLTAHKEVRPSPGYALVVDKDGPKFKESDPNSNFMGRLPAGVIRLRRGGGGVKASMTMELLARYLSNSTHHPVEDLTGLKGKYDIDLSWAPDPTIDAPPGPNPATDAASQPAAPTADLFTAIRESLGLKLEARKTQVEVLVIDHIERVPTGN